MKELLTSRASNVGPAGLFVWSLIASGLACGKAPAEQVLAPSDERTPEGPAAEDTSGARGATPSPPGSPGAPAPEATMGVGYKVGFSEVDVSPKGSVTMGGYGTYTFPNAPRRSEGIHDPLYASAFAVRGHNGQTLVVLSVDAVGLSSVSVQRIRAAAAGALAANPGPTTVLVAATHDHASPDTMGLWGALPSSGRNDAYMATLERGAAEAIGSAVRGLQPATLVVGAANKANGSSTNPDPSSRDDALLTISARAADGHMLGTFTQWSAHPTILPASNNAISADYVGAFRRSMKERFGGIPVYVNGALGGLYAADDPGTRPDPFTAGTRDPDVTGGYERSAYLGWELAEKAQASLQAGRPLSPTGVEVRSALVAVGVDNLRFLAASGLGVVETSLEAARELTWFRIGDVEGASVPGEMFPSGTQALRTMLKKHGAQSTAIVGMGNEWIGYLMSHEEYDNPTNQYQRELCPARDAESSILEAYRTLFGLPR